MYSELEDFFSKYVTPSNKYLTKHTTLTHEYKKLYPRSNVSATDVKLYADQKYTVETGQFLDNKNNSHQVRKNLLPITVNNKSDYHRINKTQKKKNIFRKRGTGKFIDTYILRLSIGARIKKANAYILTCVDTNGELTYYQIYKNSLLGEIVKDSFLSLIGWHCLFRVSKVKGAHDLYNIRDSRVIEKNSVFGNGIKQQFSATKCDSN